MSQNISIKKSISYYFEKRMFKILLLASFFGVLADWLNRNWGLFFFFITFMVIPSLLMLYKIKDEIKFNNNSIN